MSNAMVCEDDKTLLLLLEKERLGSAWNTIGN